MTEVGPADRVKLLRSKRAESSSIVVSRKRKLRELFAVATEEDGIPNHDFSNPDAPPTTTAEAKFLFESDILQGRRLNELNIPPRRRPCFDSLRLTISKLPPDENPTAPAPKDNLGNEAPLSDTTVEQERPRTVPEAAERVALLQDIPLPARSDREIAQEVPVPKSVSHGQAGINGTAPSPRPPPTDDVSASQTPAHRDQSGQSDGDTGAAGRSSPRLIAQPTPFTLENRAGYATSARSDRKTPGVIRAPVSVEQDGKPGQWKDSDVASDHQIPQGDNSRYQDVLSSPGSTALSTQTPAVHDVSTDTSPDNEGPQYIERGEEPGAEKLRDGRLADDEEGQDVNGAGLAVTPASLGDSAPATVSGVEAQLLQESAAARLSQTQPTEPSISSRLDGMAKGQVKMDVSTTIDVLRHDPLVKHSLSTAKGETDKNQSQNALALSSQEPIPNPNVKADDNHVGEPTVPMHRDPPQPSQPHQEFLGEQVQLPSSVALQTPTSAPQNAIPSISITTADTSPADDAVPDALPNASQAAAAAKPAEEQASASAKSLELLPTPEREEASSSQNLSAPQLKVLANKLREKRRRSVPTVIFGKQVKKPRLADDSALVVSKPKPGQLPTEDYFTPLFIEGFTRQSTWMKPIEKLLNQAHKTVSTPDQYLSILDHQACKILRRVYHLQQHDKWSLRQPVRCPEPTRPASHWDVLLQEMKWMRTDFREERKWKRAVARNLAYSCAEWVHSDPVERLALQVNVTIPPPSNTQDADVNMVDNSDAVDTSLPELVHSDSPRENEEESIEVLVETIAPSMIFALQDDEVVFGLQPSKTADLLLENLPMYGSPLKVPKFDLTCPEYDPDANWKRPAVPLSKYVEGEMVLAADPPPRRRGRYQYAGEDDEEDGDEVIFGSVPDHGISVPPENTNVALFSEEMKVTRDRLHAGHQFRPPSEHNMPSQSFFESRTASQWTWAEDDQLRALVKEYSYNWSLISSMVSTKSLFASGAERRTPWECFERWVNLEGLPADMAKSPYFKTYQSRIDAAQKTINQHNINNAQQHVGPNGAVTPVLKRRPTTTMRVDRRRNQKHLALIDAMRKLAKKRETTAQKAQQAASLAAMRKANEVPRQPGPTKTPRDYSLMRFERDQALAERMAAYAAKHQEAIQKRMIQQRQAHASQIPATPGGAQAMQTATTNPVNGAARLNIPTQHSVPVQNRPQARVPMQTPAVPMPAVPAQLTGGLVPPMPIPAIPQAQLQVLQAQRMSMANPQPDINLVMQARMIQDQQRQMAHQQQQQQHQQQQQQQRQQQLQQHQHQQQQQQHQQQHQPLQSLQQQAQQQQQSMPQQQQPQSQPHLQQMSQQQQQMARANSTQGSPTPMRNVVNGMTPGAFMNNAQAISNARAMLASTNAQAMMASFNAAHSTGLATSPGAGLSMPLPAGSPGRGQQPAIAERLKEFEAQFRAKHPDLPREAIRQFAMEHLSKLVVQSQQHAMNAAVGGLAQQQAINGIPTPNSPHQYAQLLRAQQQAQAAHAAQQAQAQAGQQQVSQQQVTHQQQQVGQQATPQQQLAQQLAAQQRAAAVQAAQAAQHQRQASGSAPPVPSK
ncbi:hypothetical protein B0H66DRAFT_643249 [Apodospora peruviana]|uniref:Vacuolar import and degradation protein 21 n=1 Tax=Apodospora peruviana TaxID=516989 RepID=A0AAE0LZK4_9PEZI|nr:hypothetical protein B0H66DRAFT_643249 [Apodospora peruviana]